MIPEDTGITECQNWSLPLPGHRPKSLYYFRTVLAHFKLRDHFKPLKRETPQHICNENLHPLPPHTINENLHPLPPHTINENLHPLPPHTINENLHYFN